MNAVWAHSRKKPIELRPKKIYYGSNRTTFGVIFNLHARDPAPDGFPNSA